MQAWHQQRLRNWWDLEPERDPRFDGLPRLTLALEEVIDLCHGEIDYDAQAAAMRPVYSPLQLAAMLHEACRAHRAVDGAGPGLTPQHYDQIVLPGSEISRGKYC
jgi:hypothetical protein